MVVRENVSSRIWLLLRPRNLLQRPRVGGIRLIEWISSAFRCMWRKEVILDKENVDKENVRTRLLSA